MTPKFVDFFKSFYYSNTYVPPVDLGDQNLSKYLLKREDSETESIAQRLISNPEVRSVLSAPLSYDLEKINLNNEVLKKHGFKLLSSKPLIGNATQQSTPFYSVVEHDQLPGWVIKSGATRIPKDKLVLGPLNDKNEMAIFVEEESVLRIEMAERIAKVAQKAKIDVVIPRKRLVTYSNLEGVNEVSRKYCIVCEKINVLSTEDTVQSIKKMDADHQKEIARKISTIVQTAGLVDASFDNIRLTADGRLAFIDTEPAGLMVAKKSGLLNRLFCSSRGASVEKCVRIGLFTLMNQTSRAARGAAALSDDGSVEPGLEAFRQEIENDYKRLSSPKISKWKVTVSVLSLGLIPLMNVVRALAKTQLTKRVFKKLASIDRTFTSQAFSFVFVDSEKQKQMVENYQRQRCPFAKRFFAYTEGVPYTAVLT